MGFMEDIVAGESNTMVTTSMGALVMISRTTTIITTAMGIKVAGMASITVVPGSIKMKGTIIKTDNMSTTKEPFKAKAEEESI